MDKGINLVIDTVLHDKETLEDFYYVTAGYPILLVGVHCPEDELIRREKERGDRQIGLSLQQLKFGHQQKDIYDVQVNTHDSTLEECTKRII